VNLSRWSLDQVVAGVGTLALIVLAVPVGFVLARSAASEAELRLAERADSLARILATQVGRLMLVEDELGLHDALHKAVSAAEDVRYVCAVNMRGDVAAHTFEETPSAELVGLWQENRERPVRFRTESEPMMNVPVYIGSGRLDTLHVGLSRSDAIAASRRILWVMAVALAGGLFVVFAGAQVVAVRVSRPLRQLEEQILHLPERPSAAVSLPTSATREVDLLARGFADMTARLESLEDERAATQERMVHAERLAALGELAAGLAHEIHNPLDGMLECLRYLDAEADKGERAEKYYPMLRNGLERIANVMRSMMTFARSGQNVSVESHPIADIMESLGLLVETQFEGRRVRFTWQMPGGCICLCDRQGLGQAALNLILNAAEAAEDEADPEVRIEAVCDDEWVYLAVEDSGPGIPADLHERIFDPFFTTKPVGKGTGLGLSVSRQLIRAAGGDVELCPEPGSLGGARFVIRLQKSPDSECTDGRAAG
jgi:signal transduction histidine kinase